MTQLERAQKISDGITDKVGEAADGMQVGMLFLSRTPWGQTMVWLLLICLVCLVPLLLVQGLKHRKRHLEYQKQEKQRRQRSK